MNINHRLKMKKIWVLVLMLTGLSACVPVTTNWPTVTAVATTPARQHTPLPAPSASATPFPSVTASATAGPKITRTPIRQTSAATPTPAPTLSVYKDVQITGYIADETQVHVGAFDDRLPPRSRPIYLTYTPATNEVAAQLKTLMEDTVLVRLTGDYYPAREGNGRLVIEEIENVNLPYTADTPFDAVFTDERANFSFRYPGTWLVETFDAGEEYETFSVRLTNAPADADQLRPCCEFYDPSLYDVRLTYQDTTLTEIVAEWQDTVAEILGEDQPETVTYFELQGRQVARIEGSTFYSSDQYLVPFGDGTIVVYVGLSGYDDTDFIRRLIATLTESE